MKRGIIVQATADGRLGLHNLNDDTYFMLVMTEQIARAFPQKITKATEVLFEADEEGYPLRMVPYNLNLDTERQFMTRELRRLSHGAMRATTINPFRQRG